MKLWQVAAGSVALVGIGVVGYRMRKLHNDPEAHERVAAQALRRANILCGHQRDAAPQVDEI